MITEILHAQGHQVVLLLCDRPGAYCLERAQKLGVPSQVVEYERGIPEARQKAEAQLTAALQGVHPDYIALAGFMRILTPGFVRQWAGKLVNIHPALLPRHPGAHGIEDSFASSDTELGVTVHWVDEGVDTGAVLAQRSFTRTPGLTLEDAARRIHEVEHQLYPETLLRLLGGTL